MKYKSLLIGLAIIGSIMFFGFSVFSNSSQSKKISSSEFLQTYMNTPDSILIDVRTPAEFEAGHLDGAINIDIQGRDFESNIQMLDKEKTYFVYCRSSARSGRAVKMLKQVGITQIFELKGGLISNSSLPLVEVNTNEIGYEVDASDLLVRDSSISVEGSTLTESEKKGLIQMREEEKLARDVYTALGDIWGVRIFSNISASEQTHTDAVKNLLTKYNITDPVVDDTVGVFASPQMKELYSSLVERGSTSRLEALTVGAYIEDLDIYDLEVLKTATIKEDIISVYNNLQKGSRNHLRAFVKNIEAKGGVYEPVHISQTLYLNIINTEQERGSSQ